MFKYWFKQKEIIMIEPQILDLKPDDILVLSYDYYLTGQQFETLQKQFSSSPTIAQHKILLIEGGGELSILR